ncbi:uncharacterized protein LOC110117186 [Athalia rosae]|uniref:uncharacterized protein LOC110117186 n=1 Tax=Athalia rosae TaxID=37344 RepID=UPI002034358C|nr:uncharacterized protein LOC110117186 [Athalia rosae]
MKKIYVIEVKTRSPLSSLYPSERRYSASTVGGLSLVHLGLGILAFLMGTLARSIQGPILSLACLVPFVSGLIAWKRWYIDKNISIFFCSTIFSLIVSIVCASATIFDIAFINENGIALPWRIENVLPYYKDNLNGNKEQLNIFSKNDTKKFGKTVDNKNESEIIQSSIEGLKLHYEDETPTNLLENQLDNDSQNFDSFLTICPENRVPILRTNLLLEFNVLVTCLLEIMWSFLSIKISLKGMRNRINETYGFENTNFGNPNSINGIGNRFGRIKNRAPNPEDDKERSCRSNNERNVIKDYHSVQISENSGPRLPLPESNKEFRERVERFLANQAAHRIVEGSCS